jgi:hypothetical protein
MTPRPLDEAKVEAFAGHLLELYSGGMLTFLVDIGHRTGLFAALATGPATSAGLAARADLQERYVREWLGAMASGGIVGYDPATASFDLPAEHDARLTGTGSANLAPLSRLDTHLAGHVDAVARAFREGGGVAYAAYRPEFTDVMDALGRGVFDELLVDAYLPLVPGPGRPGWPTPASRSATRPASRSRSRWTWCSPSTPSTTRPTRRPCSSGSTPLWCRAACS